MKTNKDKLTDAVGMLDEETLQATMTHANRMNRRTVLRRRAVVLLAACLSLVLMLGGVLAVPLMTRDQPVVTDGATDELPTAPPTEGMPDRFYTEVPLVKLSRLSATETADLSYPALSGNASNLSQMDALTDDLWRSFIILSFDCEPRETVTVKAGQNSLHTVALPLTESTDTSLQGEFWGALEDIYDENAPGVDTVTVNPAEACIMVRIPHSYTDLDEDRLDFTVCNADGLTVGAGSVYVGTRFLVDAEECRLSYEHLALTRSAVLGSVRLNDPTAATEAQLSELMASFAAKTNAAKAELDYTPATFVERTLYAQAEIVKEVFAGEQITGSSCDGGSDWMFRLFFVDSTDKSDKDRGFLLFSDGSWGEFVTHENCLNAHCHGTDCPNTPEDGCGHGVTVGCRFIMTDGRIYEIREQTYEGRTVRVPVLVSEATV